MAEDKEEKKEVANSVEKSTFSSDAKNENNTKSNTQNLEPSKTEPKKNESDFENQKTKNSTFSDLTGVKSDKSNTSDDLEKQKKVKAKKERKPKPNIDKKKIERIKRELMADDEPSLEQRNKVIQEKQSSSMEGFDDGGQSRGFLDKSQHIARKNEQLMEDVFRYSRQRSKDIVDARRQIITVVVTVVLVLLLIVVVALGVFMYVKQTTSYEEQYIRVSVSMTNKDIFYDTEVTGDLIPKDVSPGDKFALNVVASNSNSISGDTDIDEWLTIYVRFKVTLIVNGVEYEDYIYFEPDSDVWERYDAEVEAGYINSSADPTPVVKNDDGYYYCRKVLWPNEKVTLFTWLRFSETKITEVIGGNDAVLRVDIEALEAIPSIVKNREIWTDAPQNWVQYITTAFPDTGVHEEDNPTNVSIWWVIIFVCIAVVLVVAIIIVSTRRKKKKKMKLTDFNRKM